ncbi:Uncharacterised protein [Vibrio cholerae]|nr:Uncharacterised protein [Vibrio cholerae]
MKDTPPKIAQFTVISGRKMPSALYRGGKKRSRIISRICTNAAITPIKVIKLRKLRSTPSTSASGLSTRLYTRLLTGTEIVSTTITAIPKPNDVLTFFDTAKNVHIPRKKESAMFSMKIDFTSRLI